MTDLIKFILENQLTAEDWKEISVLMEDQDKLIRQITMLVMQDKYGKGEERRAALGAYYDAVQSKIKQVYETAEAVWRGDYGNGDDHRRELIGPDYDLVKYRVKETRAEHGELTVKESEISVTRDQGGRRYVLPAVPTALGIRDYHGYKQTAQGDNPYNFSGSGCGISSAYACVSTKKGYDMSLREWADKNLAAVGGTICPISTAIMERLLAREGMRYTRLRNFTTDSLTASVKAHLKTGNPVILALTRCNRAGVSHKGRYANSEHYAVLTHMNADGKRAFLLDSSGDPNRGPRWVDLHDICDHVPTAKAKETFKEIWNGWSNCGGVLLVYMK
jgi:hypothetical protein